MGFIGCASSPRTKRVEALKHLQDEVEKYKAVASDVVELKKQRADTEVMVEDLKAEFQLVKGRVEEFQHFSKKNEEAIQGLKDRFDRFATDYDTKFKDMDLKNEEISKKLDQLQKDVEAIISKMGELQASKKKAQEVASAQTDVKYDYVNGMKRYRNKEYTSAITYFSRYIKNFPAGRNVHNSRFFLADAFFEKADYQNAILKYEEYKEKYPSGQYVAQSLFNQGLSFKKLGKVADAKLFFSELVNAHPTSPFAAKAKAELEKM